MTWKSRHSKICPYCGNLFIPKFPSQRYCVNPHTYICEVCGREFGRVAYLDDIPDKRKPIDKISLAKASVSVKNQTYSGNKVTPGVTVKLNSETLTLGVDYTVKYSNNLEPGIATVTVLGAGKYSGSVEKTFTINPVPIKDCTIQLIDPQICQSDKYTKIYLTPSTHVRLRGKVFRVDTNYSIVYSNNCDIGTASITLTGRGQYLTGSTKIVFEIESKEVYDNVKVLAIPDQVYTGRVIKPEPIVMFKGMACVKGVDYTLSYKDHTNVGIATIEIKPTNSHVLSDGTKVAWDGVKRVHFRIVKES